MKKFIFLTVLFVTLSLSTKIYATCSVSSNSAYCTVTSNNSTSVYDSNYFYITPYTDVYFNSTVQSLGYPGSAGIVAYTDYPTGIVSPFPWQTGPSNADWSDGLYDTYGVSSSYYGIHWQTYANGWIDLDVQANDGYAYVSATW
jgi:hypothetical protein